MAETNTTFYYGTSKEYNIGDTLIINKVNNPNAPWKKFGYAKVYVTKDLSAAKYYAEKSAAEVKGTPHVYIVAPDKISLVKANKTDYTTSNATVIDIVSEEALNGISQN